MAPDVWHRLMKSLAPEEFFEELGIEEQNEVSRWKQKRNMLLPDRIKKEIDAELECDTTLIRKSIPFMKIDLAGSNSGVSSIHEEKEAQLTIWEPTDDQANLLKDNSTIELHNLAVKDTQYEGVLQLTATNRTLIEAVPDSSSTSIRPAALKTPATMFDIHLLSHKRKPLQPICAENADHTVDTVATVIRIVESEEIDTKLYDVYVTDETKLTLKIHCDLLPADLPLCDEENFSDFVTGRFYRLQVKPFDYEENCAVAQWREDSSFTQYSEVPSTARRMEALCQWSSTWKGISRLLSVQCHVDAQVPSWEQDETRVAIGYVVGLRVEVADQSTMKLLLAVDCALANDFQEWEVTASILEAMLSMVREDDDEQMFGGDTVALPSDEEERAAKLEVLGSIMRGRGVLWRFQLQKVDHDGDDDDDGFPCDEFIVTDASLADTEGIGHVYGFIADS